MTKLILSQKPRHFYQHCHCWKSNTYIWTKVSFIIGETTIMKNILITRKKKMTSLKCLQDVSLQKTLTITSNIKKTYIPVCNISCRPIDNVYVVCKIKLVYVKFSNILYIMYSEVYVKWRLVYDTTTFSFTHCILIWWLQYFLRIHHQNNISICNTKCIQIEIKKIVPHLH